MSAHRNRDDARRRLGERYRRLAETRKKSLAGAVAARFTEIDGGTLGVVVSVQLVTTVIPLIIIGFDFLSGFAESVSPGALIIRELGLVSPLSERVREAFGDSSAFRTSWTFIGVAGFLVWGIPMSITIAGIFAKAWRREQFGLGGRLWRGATWFVIYLLMIGLRERIALGGEHPTWIRALLFVAALVPIWIFWSLTPVLLVLSRARGPGRDGDRRSHYSTGRPNRLSAATRGLERVGPDRRRDGIDDVVRGGRRRMGPDSVRGRGPVGAHSPGRHCH